MAITSTPNSGQTSGTGIEQRKQALAAKRAAQNNTASQAVTSQPQTPTQTPAVTTNNNYALALRAANRQAQRAAQPATTKYTFNGKSYNSQAEMQSAQDKYTKLAYYDFLSVGGDVNQFALMTRNKQGLANISDDEWNYINRLSREDTTPTAHTKSKTDQYLYQLGLPSSKDIAQYRAKYVKYSSTGGILDVYKDLTEDEYNFIQKRFNEDTVAGFNGERIPKDTKNGKAIEYEDTLLDAQLKSAGLPSSELMNLYHAEYLRDKEIDADIEKFYSTVHSAIKLNKSGNESAIAELEKSDAYQKADTVTRQRMMSEAKASQSSSMDTFREVLERPEFSHLKDYYFESVQYPNRQDYITRDDYGRETFNEDKYNADLDKAVIKDTKRTDARHRVSYTDFEEYDSLATVNDIQEAEASSRTALRDTALGWFKKGATTEEEKKQRTKDINAFVRFGNNENNIKQAMQALAASEWYFEALDAGIPAEVAIKGKGAIASWNNDSNTSDVKKWTEIAMAGYGYTKGDPPYDKIYDAVRRTRIEANATGFERNSVYDASLYNRQLLPDGSVTLYGAAYAEVNGIEHGAIQQSDDGEASHIFDYLFRTYDTEKGEARVKSLNDMERGVFNAIYRRNPKEALNYLMSLSDMLSDRSFDETYGSFDMGTVAEMSDDDYYGYMYDAYVYEENDKNSRYVEGTSNGWKRSAWENYKQYNDEEIDELIAESQATAARMQDAVASGEVSQEEAAAFFMSATDAQRGMRYVKEQRENARVNARNAVELRGYRDEDGKKATEIVSANIEAYEQESQNVRLVNQAPTDNPYKTENAPTFSGGMNTSTIDLSGLKTYAEDEQMPIFAEMTPEQRDQFNWLLVNKGADSADAYIGSLREGLDIMAARRIQEKESAYATQGWNEVLTSFASIVGYPVTGMTSLIGTGLDYAAGIDVSRTQATQWDTTGVWREAISKEIGDQFGGLGSFVYDAVMSTCDSSVAMAVDTMLPFMGESFMAASAYASSLRQGLDEGLDSDHAVFSALVSAAIEFATEHAGLDAIGQNIATIGKKGVPWQQFVKGVLGSSVSEGSEELLSHVLNTAADALINGDKQALIRNHDLLMEEKGFTDEEAWAQVWKDWAVEAGMSYAAGAFSGGLMTGVGGLGKAMRAGAVKLDSKIHEFAYGTPPVKPMTEQQVEAFNNGGEWLKSVIPGTAYTAITDMVNNNRVDTGKVDSLKQAITNRGNSGVQSYIDSMGLDVSNDNNLTALATSLAAMNCSADIDSIDAAITRLMTADMSVQTKSDRNMASKDNIKSPEALGFLYETVQKFRQKIQDDQTTYNNWANPILTDLNDRALRIKSIQDSAAAEQDVGKKGALLKEASTLQAQYDKDYKKFKQQEKDQKRKLRDRLKDSETQIKTAQNSINKHFASLASFLSAYAPKSYDGGRSRRAQLDYREKKYGAELDKYMKSTTLSEKDKAAQITRVNNILDDTRAQRERLNQALSDEGNTLGKALQAARNGTVADFIQRYNEARASKTAETNSTVEDTTNPASEQKTASEKATDNLKTTNPVDVEISQKDQRSLTRSFARVGIELVWESRDKVGNGRANGFYNPDDHKIHLATTMRTSKGDMPSLKIAQAVIVHEVTHFSAGTEGFIDLKNSAIDFLTNKYGAQWVDDVLNSIAEHYYEDYGQILSEPDVQEELTAYFVEDMLFNGQSGDEQALNRLTKKNRGLVSQILDYIQRMIARGTVRKMSNGDPVKLALFDCETKLARALHERQYLDKIGKESAFEASDEQQNVEAEPMRYEQGEPQVESQADDADEDVITLDEDVDEVGEQQLYSQLESIVTSDTASKEDKKQARELASQMVKDAAVNNGYVLSAYHGTTSKFNEFVRNKTEGIHLGTKKIAKEVADLRFDERSYKGTAEGKHVMPLYAKIQNPLVFGRAITPFTASNAGFYLTHAYLAGKYGAKTVDKVTKAAINNRILRDANISDEEYRDLVQKLFPRDTAYTNDELNEIQRIGKYIAEHELDVEKDIDVLEPLAEIVTQGKNDGSGFTFFMDWVDPEEARAYGLSESDLIYKRYEGLENASLNLSDPIIRDAYKHFMDVSKNEGYMSDKSWDALAELLSLQGYDGIKYVNISEGNVGSRNNWSWIALRPSDVKSAEPFVYDDNGKLIPISERFNPKENDIRYSSGGMSLEDFARAYSLRSDSAASYYDAGKLMDARYLKGKSSFNLAQDVFSAVDNAFADRGYNVFDYHVLNSLQHNLDTYSKLYRERTDRPNIGRKERYAFARASAFVDALKQISNTLSKPVLMSYDSFRFDRRFYMSSYLSAHNSMNIAKNRSAILTDENLSDSDKKTLGRLWESVERQYAGMYNFLKSDFINVLNRYIDPNFIRKAQTSGTVSGSDEKRNRKKLYDTAKSSFFDESEYDSPAMQSKEIPNNRYIGFNVDSKADSYTSESVPKEEQVVRNQEPTDAEEREQIRREANEVRTRLANDLNNRTQFEWFGNVEDAPTVFRDSATQGRDFNSPDFIIPSYAQEGYDGMTSWEREQRDARLEDEHEERMNDARYSNDSDIRKMPGYKEAVDRYSNTLYQFNADEARNRVPEPRFVGTENDNRYSSGMSLQDYARAAREGDSQLLPGIENMSEELRQDIANTLEQTGGDLFDRAVEYGKAGTGFVYGRGEFGGSVSDIPYLFGRTEQSGAVSDGSQEGESSVRYAVPDADTGENIREAENVRYASHLTMGDLVGRYGGHKQNAFAKDNDIQIAKKRYKNLNYSKSMQTLSSVEYIQQSVRDFIAESALSADFNRQNNSLLGTYRTKTLDAAEKYAENAITRKGGLSDALIEITNELKGALDSHNSSNLEHLMAKSNVLFRDLGAEGMGTIDPYQFHDFLSSLMEYRSAWGRSGNLMKLVNKLPQARKMYWEKVVTRMNKENIRRTSKGVNQLFYRDGVDEIKVPEPLYDALVAARNQTEINEAEYAITQYIGEHSPLTVSAALRNWRYFAMLANPVTHARNMLGNTGMLGGRMAKDAIAAGLESVAVKTGLMKDSDRTHSLTLTEESKDIAQQLWDEYRDIVQQDGHIGFRQNVREATKKSPSKLIDFLMRKNGNALESEDKLFLYATFMSAARQYITAQGITAKNMTKAQRNSIAAYATQQAQEATYRDAVKIADILHQVSQMNPVAEFMVDSIMPFKKTPINIARRGIEYSPVGLGIGLYHLAKDAVQNSKGKKMSVSAAKVCDELAKGLTGTALSMIGFFLSKAGILKISAGEGDRDEAFEKDVGHQDYSIEIGDLSIKIEQLAPLTFPLFMGASFEKLNSADKDWFTLDDFGEALLTVADPLMDMSFLSGLNTALETYNENSLSGVFGNMILSYGGQFLPTIGSKINNTTPFVGDTRMTAKSSAAAKSSKLDYQLRAWASKIPGLNKAVLEPYVSTTGEFQQKNNWQDWVLAHLNNFALPTNVQILDSSPVNEEIARLYSVTGTKDFIPENPKKYMRVNGKDYKMNAKEYTEFSKEHNEMVYTALSNVINSFDYQNSSDDHKAEMLEYAFDTAHKAVSEKYKYIFANNPQK